MEILSQKDLDFFEANGYLHVPGVVPKENCNAVIAAIFEFLGMDPNNLDDWYRMPLTPGGMVEMYHHQTIWDNRQHPRMHKLFAELIGTEKLWVTLDRVNMKPPFREDHPEYDHKGFTHWDVDTSTLPVPFWVQGVLYLSDTDETMGGFQCIPGFHKNLEEWIAKQPEGRNPFVPDLKAIPEEYKLIPIPGKAGDMVIWDRLLAHGNGRNKSNLPRFAQYIAMRPDYERDEAEREERIKAWQTRTHLKRPYFYGDPRETEVKHGKTAELTPLGRKLLGIDAWD